MNSRNRSPRWAAPKSLSIRPPFPVAGAQLGPVGPLDLHEEPFGVAVAEVLFIRWLRRRHVPFVVYSAQNIEKRYPPPFRWFERWSLRRAAGAYTCNVEASRILRAKGLAGPAVVIPLGVDISRFAG